MQEIVDRTTATASRAEDKDKRTFTYNVLEVKINESNKTVSCKLKMPSKLPQKYDSKYQGDNPIVFLDLQSCNADGDRCFQMMKEIIHPNILHARGINTTQCHLLLWVEPYTGNLLDFLETSLRLNQKSALMGSKRTVLPTESFQSIVRQIIDGLNHLRIQGSYHGDFTLEGTYYHLIKPEIFVKLTNFKEKGAKTKKTLYLNQLEDLKALGTELMLVSGVADNLNKVNKTGHMFDTFILDNLAKKMQAAKGSLYKTYEVIKKNPFFWNVNERKRFFIYRVAIQMKDSKIQTKVENCKDLCSLPWNADDHDGFLPLMNQFRANRPSYNGYSRCDFVLFICGMYAHEHEEPLVTCGKKVDETVINIHPHICLLLSDLLEDSNGDWL